jgi:hypothetical protein
LILDTGYWILDAKSGVTCRAQGQSIRAEGMEHWADSIEIVAQSSSIKGIAIKSKPGWAAAGFCCYLFLMVS